MNSMYHGTARFRSEEDFNQFGAKHGTGIITAYLPEEDIFAVIFGEGQWITFHCTEAEFLERFEVVLTQGLNNENG